MAIRLLIVDPDRTLLELYCAYFGHFGLQTSTATEGLTAAERFIEQHIDVVMLEPHLLQNGSHHLLGTIASHTDQRPLPVILLSRRSQNSLAFPVHNSYVKPASMSEVLASILTAAGRDLPMAHHPGTGDAGNHGC